jgi:hypothetical protein
MGSIIFVETCAEAAVKRERVVIEEKMDPWAEAVDALNAACREFSKYYVSKCDDDKTNMTIVIYMQKKYRSKEYYY